MAQELNNFIRKEKKFIISDEELAILKKELAPYTSENSYGSSRVKSVYYDNADYDLINRSIEKPRYKEKLRTRAYFSEGRQYNEDTLNTFAEIKKKYNGIVYKRRVSGSYNQIDRLLNYAEKIDGQCGQIQDELLFMMARYNLRPKVLISCDRLPLNWIGETDTEFQKDLRITIDSNLKYQNDEPYLLSNAPLKDIIPENLHIMELKSSAGLPMTLCNILSRNRIYPGSFSKIGRAFADRIFTEYYNQ